MPSSSLLSPHFVYVGAVYFVSPKAHPFQWWNYWFLLGLSIGNGLMIYSYVLEYYARAHCHVEVCTVHPLCLYLHRLTRVLCRLACCDLAWLLYAHMYLHTYLSHGPNCVIFRGNE